LHYTLVRKRCSKEAPQQGNSALIKIDRGAEKRLRWFHARWIGTNGVRGDESLSPDPDRHPS
jgi:hypothetical protein